MDNILNVRAREGPTVKMSYWQIGFHDIKNISTLTMLQKTSNGKSEPLSAYD